jgi:hypothetical protein
MVLDGVQMMCRGAVSSCACRKPSCLFLAVTNCVSPGLRGLAAVSPNRVTKRVAADFYPAKGENQKGVSPIWPGSTVISFGALRYARSGALTRSASRGVLVSFSGLLIVDPGHGRAHPRNLLHALISHNHGGLANALAQPPTNAGSWETALA